MEMVRVLAGAGAAMGLGWVYYSTATPTGRLFQQHRLASGKSQEQEVGKSMAITSASVLALSALIAHHTRGTWPLSVPADVGREGGSEGCSGGGWKEWAKLAGALTLVVGLADLPHSLQEGRALLLFPVQRGYDFLALLALVVANNVGTRA